MKKIIFSLIVILFAGGSAYSQIYITTNLRQDGKFNKLTKVYDSVFRDKKELTLFEFDKNFTSVIHQTNAKTSTYLIKSITKDDKNGRWEFDVLSDAGYSYYMIIDLVNNNIRFIYRANDSTYLAQFTIDSFLVN
jgi:hypothetical protein